VTALVLATITLWCIRKVRHTARISFRLEWKNKRSTEQREINCARMSISPHKREPVMRGGHSGLAVLSSEPLSAQSDDISQKGRPGGLEKPILSEVVRLDGVQSVRKHQAKNKKQHKN